MAPLLAAGAVLLGTSLVAPDGRAQSGIAAEDSAALRESLVRAQRDFERLRRRFLPFTLDEGPRPCPERVGRFCVWPDDEENLPEDPPPEHDRVITARGELLTRLDSAAALVPGDGWIAGQRIRYLLEVNRLGDAEVAAGACEGDSWWCKALQGAVAHTLADFERAERVFTTSLATAPDDVRCHWTDLTLLLDRDAARSYEPLTCAERAQVNHRILWLADPLWMTSGNERLTEHFTRHTFARLFAGTETPHEIPWGNDAEELLIRFGPPEVWEQSRRYGNQPTVIGRRSPSARSFLPPGRFLDSLPAIGIEPWPLESDRGREAFRPSYAKRFTTLAPEIAVFHRDGYAVLVTAFTLDTTDHLPQQSATGSRMQLDASVLFAVAPDTNLTAIPASVGPTVARFTVVTPYRSGVLSVEALRAPDSTAARHRTWVDLQERPPGSLGVSDLLLLRSGLPLPASLETAAPIARGTNQFESGEEVNVFWEVYTPPVAERLGVTLDVVQRGRSFFRKAAEWLGLAGRTEPSVRMEWTLSWPDNVDVAPEAITLQLPSDEEGRFTLVLSVTSASGAAATAHHDIAIGR